MKVIINCAVSYVIASFVVSRHSHYFLLLSSIDLATGVSLFYTVKWSQPISLRKIKKYV